LLGCPGHAETSGGSLSCVSDASDPTAPVLWQVSPEGGRREFGTELAVVEDATRDGCPDVLVGGAAPYRSERRGTVLLASGATGAIVETLTAPEGCDGFGSCLTIAGDVDGDGKQDVAVGAPGAQSVGTSGLVTGRVCLYSLAGGAPMLREIGGRNPGDGFGSSVVAIEDQTGDGVPELMVLSSPFPPDGGRGAIDVVDPANGALVHGIELSATAPWPERLFAIGDIDGDGLSEVGLHVMRADWLDGYSCESLLVLHGVVHR